MTIANAEQIITIASQVEDGANTYRLSHAVIACEKIIEKAFNDQLAQEEDSLKKSLKLAKDKKEADALTLQLENLKSGRPHIFVDYLNIPDSQARAVRAGSNLTIVLPKSLVETNTRKSRKELRKIMAHELGHIVLHTRMVIEHHKTNGTLDLTGQNDDEANCFAKELLRLRCAHYERALKDEEYKDYW